MLVLVTTGVVVPLVVGLRVAGGVVRRGVVGLFTGVVVVAGLLVGGLVVGLVVERPVLPPPIVPPPLAGSCCADAMLAREIRQMKAEIESRGRRHLVFIVSPANQTTVEVERLRTAGGHYILFLL